MGSMLDKTPSCVRRMSWLQTFGLGMWLVKTPGPAHMMSTITTGKRLFIGSHECKRQGRKSYHQILHPSSSALGPWPWLHDCRVSLVMAVAADGGNLGNPHDPCCPSGWGSGQHLKKQGAWFIQPDLAPPPSSYLPAYGHSPGLLPRMELIAPSLSHNRNLIYHGCKPFI